MTSFKEIYDDLLSKNKFKTMKEMSEQTKYNYSYLSELKNNKKPIKPEFVQRINLVYKTSYEYVGPNGLGKPFKNPNFDFDKFNKRVISEYNEQYRIEAKPVPFEHFEEVDFISINAQAGLIDKLNASDPTYVNDLDKMLIPKQFDKGKYIVVEVSGDSMDDGSKRSICNGDKLLCKELQKHHWYNKLHIRKNLFVIVGFDGVVVKQILEHDVEKGIIVCHSYNRLIPDYTIQLNEVHQLLYVKKVVERKIDL